MKNIIKSFRFTEIDQDYLLAIMYEHNITSEIGAIRYALKQCYDGGTIEKQVDREVESPPVDELEVHRKRKAAIVEKNKLLVKDSPHFQKEGMLEKIENTPGTQEGVEVN